MERASSILKALQKMEDMLAYAEDSPGGEGLSKTTHTERDRGLCGNVDAHGAAADSPVSRRLIRNMDVVRSKRHT